MLDIMLSSTPKSFLLAQPFHRSCIARVTYLEDEIGLPSMWNSETEHAECYGASSTSSTSSSLVPRQTKPIPDWSRLPLTIIIR